MGKNKGVCFECLAGSQGVPFEDVRRSPTFAATIHLEKPWLASDPSPLLDMPGRTDHPESIFHKDPFHIFKQSIGGHFVCSSIILFGEMGFWPGASNAVDSMLERAFLDFDFYMNHEYKTKQVSHAKHFSKALFHAPTVDHYPYGRLKGSDMMLLCRWLRHLTSAGIVSDVDVPCMIFRIVFFCFEFGDGALKVEVAFEASLGGEARARADACSTSAMAWSLV